MANQSDIADTIKAIQADVTTIVRGEIELAKAELIPQAKSVGIGAGLLGGAGYLAAVGGLLVFLALGLLVGYFLAAGLGWAPLLAACVGVVIVVLVMFLIAGVLALVAKKKIEEAKGLRATTAQGQASVDAVKGAVELGQLQAEAEAEQRKAARRAAPSITSGTPGPSFVSPTS